MICKGLTFLTYIAVIHPYYSVLLQFICFGYCIIFHGLNIPQFIYLLFVHRHLNYYQVIILLKCFSEHSFAPCYTGLIVSLGFMPRNGIVEL